MSKETRTRLKRACEFCASNPWTLDAAMAVLRSVAIDNPNAFLVACRAVVSGPISTVFDGFNLSSLMADQQGSPDVVPSVPEPASPEPESTPTETPQDPAKAAAKSRPAKRAKKPKVDSSAPEPALGALAGDGRDEPTELTAVWLESYNPTSKYLLQRALAQATGFNEAKVQELLNSNLPVEVQSFCQPLHAEKIQKALMRVKGVTAYLKTTPIRTGLK